MKKKNILLLLLVALFPITAKAVSIEMKCTPTSIYVGESVRCVITAKDSIVSGGAGLVSVSNGTITNREKLHCAAPSISDEFTCYDEIQEGSLDLVAYTIKSSNAGTMTITLSNASVVDSNFNQPSVPGVTRNITVSNRPTQAPSTKAPTTPVTPSPQPQTEAPTQGQQQNEAPVTEAPTESPTEAPTEGTTITEATKDTKLERLNIEGITFTFQSDKLEYNIEVPNSVEELKIDYKAFNPNAVVEVSTTKLVDGMNNIEVKVTYEGITSVYKLNIKRIPAKNPKTDSTKIIKLVVSLIGMIGLSFLLIIVIKK